MKKVSYHIISLHLQMLYFIFRERKQKQLLGSKVATRMTTDYLSDQMLPSNFTHFTTCLDWNQGCWIYFQLRLREKEWKAKPQFEEEHNNNTTTSTQQVPDNDWMSIKSNSSPPYLCSNFSLIHLQYKCMFK